MYDTYASPTPTLGSVYVSFGVLFLKGELKSLGIGWVGFILITFFRISFWHGNSPKLQPVQES